MILVVSANTNTCRIYFYKKHPSTLKLVKELFHPESRLKGKDLTSDKPGHYQGGESSRGAFSPHLDAKENEYEHFAREIAKELNHERNVRDYEKLILITAPHMNGLVLQYLDKHVKQMMINNIHKDLINYSEHELLEYLQNNTEFPDVK